MFERDYWYAGCRELGCSTPGHASKPRRKSGVKSGVKIGVKSGVKSGVKMHLGRIGTFGSATRPPASTMALLCTYD